MASRKKENIKKASKKKVISKTEKKLRGKIKYLKSKNKKILNEIDLLSKKGDDKFIKYEGRKRKVSTVKNILKNKITKNNSSYFDTFSKLENRFKYKLIKKTKKVKAKQKGVFISPNFSAWETKDAKKWVTLKNKKGVLNDIILNIFESIDNIILSMGSDNLFFIEVSYNENEFSVNLAQ